MTIQSGLRNPYIAGRALGQQHGFFGREDILRLVETTLRTTDQNALVLFGQRRIGKTSILLQLQRCLPSPPFLPVYFDLMDRARKPLGHVLFELASTMAADAGIEPTEAGAFDDEGLYFRQEFLPALYKALGEDRRPILLLDEFDVLDVAAEEQLPPVAAARAFFPYLRKLMQGEPRLGFVFVVGRRAEDLFIEFKATFKASLYQRVSVLDASSARELITTAQRQGTLSFEPTAIDRILALTAGHPYFTQLLCQILWNDAYAGEQQATPLIDIAAVEVAAAKGMDAGQNIFEWIWDGLPPAERVVFAAIAGATDERSVVTEDELLDLLQRHGIRILTGELELAPETLVEWEMLQKTDGGYRFLIEMMRRWVASRKSLAKVKDELDRIVPLADNLFRVSEGYYQQRDLEKSQELLREALRINPNHLKARLLLGQELLEQNRLDEAVRELEEAYRYDETAGRYPLLRALLVLGEDLERAGKDDAALNIYERMLDLSPREKVARERFVSIWTRRGDEAIKADDLTTALTAYQKASLREKVAEIEALQRKRELDKLSAEAQGYERRGEWGNAIAIYQQLATQHPEDQRWRVALDRIENEQRERELAQTAALAQDYEQREEWDEATKIYQQLMAQRPEEKRWHAALDRIKAEQELSRKYTEGLGALEQGNWPQAQRSLADVVNIRPDYKNAADLLSRAVRAERMKEPLRSLRLHPRMFASLSAVFLLVILGVSYQIYGLAADGSVPIVFTVITAPTRAVGVVSTIPVVTPQNTNIPGPTALPALQLTQTAAMAQIGTAAAQVAVGTEQAQAAVATTNALQTATVASQNTAEAQVAVAAQATIAIQSTAIARATATARARVAAQAAATTRARGAAQATADTQAFDQAVAEKVNFSNFRVVKETNTNMTVEIDYNYDESRDYILYIGLICLSNGRMLAIEYVGHNYIDPGNGKLHFDITCKPHADDPSPTTDHFGINVYIGERPYLKSTFEYVKTWPISP